MTRTPEVHIFAGPTLYGTPWSEREHGTVENNIIWHAPARRGDVARLIEKSSTPSVIALIDGTFHDYPSIGHAELRKALRAGWLIYGLCSMGAIRAAEMQHMGMRPYGKVAEAFCTEPDMPDDEVTLVHQNELPYFPFSEPLIHIRTYLQSICDAGWLAEQDRAAIESSMRERWYGKRTLGALKTELLPKLATENLTQALAALKKFDSYRLKQQDLISFLEEKPWFRDFTADFKNEERPLISAELATLAMTGHVPQGEAVLNSSLRTRTAEESLALVRPLALQRGVSRVVNTTWLDILGLPVFASIRPNSPDETLAVHNGKGLRDNEAKIGAYMEAIEFSYAEPGRNILQPKLANPVEILASFNNGIGFVEFCPSQKVTEPVQADEQISVVEAEELMGQGATVLIPTELVVQPYRGPTRQIYGTDTNGLASGNTVEEATVHALAEVMERHVQSFVDVGSPTYLVDLDTLPAHLKGMVAKFTEVGLQLHLRYAPNDFGLAYFSAYVLEDSDAPAAMAFGAGFHCNKDIAAVRAISEAAQSRLTAIHGGRDDLIEQHEEFDKIGPENVRRGKMRARQAVADATGMVSFADVPEIKAASVPAAKESLFSTLKRAGLNYVARVVLTEKECPFQVVRVVVPGAERYNPTTARIGPRLLQYVTNKRKQPVVSTN